ncbi:helix-turn-helix domain-containing protein [Oenococcus sicerae]|uniref:helix-turn-helix domain-containing protein n=1 Tax=Oenococcus sicerae TaxID=2203724 RepID=UPI0039EBD985
MQYTDDLFKINLSRAIKESGLSNAEIARRVNVGRSTITQWVKGVSSPTQSKIIKIARTLNQEPSWFFIEHSKDEEITKSGLNQKQLTIARTIDPDISEDHLKQILTYIHFIQEHEANAN